MGGFEKYWSKLDGREILAAQWSSGEISEVVVPCAEQGTLVDHDVSCPTCCMRMGDHGAIEPETWNIPVCPSDYVVMDFREQNGEPYYTVYDWRRFESEYSMREPAKGSMTSGEQMVWAVAFLMARRDSEKFTGHKDEYLSMYCETASGAVDMLRESKQRVLDGFCKDDEVYTRLLQMLGDKA